MDQFPGPQGLPTLLDLVESSSLAELVRLWSEAGGVNLFLLSPNQEMVVSHVSDSSVSGSECVVPVDLEGRTLALVRTNGGNERQRLATAQGAGRTISQLLRISYARYTTALHHETLMVETFAELADKNTQLAEAVEKLKEVDRVKSNFLSTISHELRTPLTSIIGYTDMVLEGLAGPLAPEQDEYLRIVMAKADQLLQLITGILDVARLETGPIQLDRRSISMGDIVRRAIATFTGEAERRQIKIESSVSSNLPRNFGDSRRLKQVISHLLANAIKFTSNGGKVQVLSESAGLADGKVTPEGAVPSAVKVTVIDTGIGIPKHLHTRIFEPFFQVDQSSTRAFGGTGLGLSLAKNYVEAHGGKIWVESTPGHGSSFVFLLPAQAEDSKPLVP